MGGEDKDSSPQPGEQFKKGLHLPPTAQLHNRLYNMAELGEHRGLSVGRELKSVDPVAGAFECRLESLCFIL